jgi:phage-related protein
MVYHIYSIESHVTPETYVGITRDLDLSEYYHRTCSEDGQSYLYNFIRTCGGWKNFFINHLSSHDTLEEAKDKKVSGSLNIYDLSIIRVPTIYKIFCRDPQVTEQYIGQTINFDNRRFSHFLSSTFHENDLKLYEFIRSHGGWKNWKMEIVRQYPINTTKYELDRLEWYWWEKLGGFLNSMKPGSHKEKWKGSDKEFEECIYSNTNREKFSIKEINLDI